ncbi:MAG: CoA-binding protein [Candidatus Thorarchaeota archaeon]
MMSLVNRPKLIDVVDIKSVAIVGVSMNLGYYWAHSMLQWDHDLNVYLVSRSGGNVLGHDVLTDVNQIPTEIDYAIIAVPRKYVPEVLKQCSEKGAKGVTVFSSGYSELGTEEGKEYESELQKLAHSLPTRVIGPNCMGLCDPALGFAFLPTVKRGIGNVGFLSQSGGVAMATYTAGVESGLGFSKLFSFGNSIDVSPSEILDLFKSDTKTEVVGAYIEGTREGKNLYPVFRELAEKKPVVVLKGGRSVEGSRAASSHTGALAGNRDIWQALFKQVNVPTVTTLEELVATLSIFSLCPPPKSANVGIVAISGGASVIYTDLCVEQGLNVPRTSEETLTKLDELINDVGTGLGNPIDLAADYYNDDTMREVISLVGQEERFDSIIIEADTHKMHQVASIMGAHDVLEEYWIAMAKVGREVMKTHQKPVLVVVPDIAYPEARSTAWNVFVKEDLPVFRNISESIGAIDRVNQYYRTKSSRERN